MNKMLKLFGERKNKGTLLLIVILVVVFIIGTLLSDSFINKNNLQNVLFTVSIYGLLALGETAVLLVKEIDLSIGAIVGFAPMFAIFLANLFLPVIQGGNYVATGTLVIIIFALVISVLAGFINGLIRVKLNISSLIATLGMMYIMRGLTYMFFNGHSLYMTNLKRFVKFSSTRIFNIPLPFLFFALCTLILGLLLTFTIIGRRIYATGGNAKAAAYSGISVAKWKIIAFCFSGFCSGLAALIYTSRMQTVEVVQGGGYELMAIAIAVVGGTTLEGGRGTVFGTFLASLILCFILNIMALNGLMSWYQNGVVGLIIVGAALQYAYINRIQAM
jgi:ribose/xylose/arabinose/galactoside ABC-type transport system permease subunit